MKIKYTIMLLLFSCAAWGQNKNDTSFHPMDGKSYKNLDSVKATFAVYAQDSSIVKICGKYKGTLKKSKLLSKPYLTISKNKLKWKITSFEATFATDKGQTKVCTIMGDKFSGEFFTYLCSIRKGSHFFIDNIRAVNYKNETKNLNPIVLLIEYQQALETSEEAKIEAKKLDSLIKVIKQLKKDSAAFFDYGIKSTYYREFKSGSVLNEITPKLILEGNLYPWSFNVVRKKKIK